MPSMAKGLGLCDMSAERKREAVSLLKKRFLSWRNPPVELPAESVIEEVVEAIYDMGWDDGYEEGT